ncbi:hypothetical protein EPI10_020068 [Gossypium australe]|uniref:Uncharacterized protein n=1 Tax=Gossypium australe TaxID=47621 RepID=A0A5B6WEI6_9ROSI|nr:hypothetical protein EPI10_020068 [Gossypium australe]
MWFQNGMDTSASGTRCGLCFAWNGNYSIHILVQMIIQTNGGLLGFMEALDNQMGRNLIIFFEGYGV